VATSVSQLLNSVYQAQREYVRTALPGTKALNSSTSRCLEKAKEIAQLVETLVTLMSGNNPIRQDEVESLAKAINAATAHLVSAHKARGDPSSRTYQMVIEAAKVASSSIQELLRTAQEVSQPIRPPMEIDPSGMSFRNELETYAKIAKLEKELESARQDLFNSRKAKYQNPL
jgi:hypothetical protein